LPLPTFDKLETIRFVGQHYYLLGNHAKAVEIFSRAANLSVDDVPPDYQSSFSRTLGNVLYLKGLALGKLKDADDEETIENFSQLVADPKVVENIPVVTSVSAFYKLGRLYYLQSDFEKAESSFRAGLDILDKKPDPVFDADKDYRIKLEIGGVMAGVAKDNPEDPDYAAMLDRLDQLRTEYSAKGHADFDRILRTRVNVAAAGDDRPRYRQMIEEWRNYYKKKYQTVRDWAGSRDDFLQSSKLLIRHLLESKDEKVARQILRETRDLARPPADWYFGFPKEFVNRAFEKSVLEKIDDG
jgi:tetratricopeptide (TPR) repeat protein